MSRATIIAAAALLIAVPVVAVTSGALDWISGDSASAALSAEDVRLAPPGVSTDATEEGAAADLGVAGGPLDCPPAGPGPEDAELLFQRQGVRFWVTGTLSSFDGMTAVVAGPTGDILAALAPEFRLVGDLSPGSAVQMTGTAASDGSMTALEVRSVCAGAGVIDCATGDDPSFELKIQGDTFEVTGRLESLTNDTISVVGPGLVVQIARDAGTTVEGGVDAGDPVRVEGTVADAQQLRALAVALRCEAALTPAPSPAASPAPAGVQEVQQQNNACNPGNGIGAVRFEVDEDGEAEIKRGAVTASAGNSLTVETPRGPVTVILDEDTEIKGDLASAAVVTVKGELQDDNSILADEVKVQQCPNGGDENRRNEDDKEKDKERNNREGDDDEGGGGGEDDSGEEGGDGDD